MAQVKIPAYHFPDRSGPQELGTPFRKIVIGQVLLPGILQEELDEDYQELCRLVETLDGKVVGRAVQKREKIHQEFYVGPGKADEIGTICDDEEADTVVIDGELNPTQVAHLEYETGSHVMDRRELILEIFSRRAGSAESKIQVELAYLNFLHPKMEKGTSVRAYRGGLRGHGESLLGKRIRAGRARAQMLQKKLKKMEKSREGRKNRRSGLWGVALVGYTNAGKSTLLNALANENLYADDRLFATLDTTTRRVFLKQDCFALFSDTVGFIRKLPHELVASFHSTLSEALEADLLLHVADASSSTVRKQMATVEHTLETLNAAGKPILTVFNKIDAAETSALDILRGLYPEAVFLSAIKKEGLDEFRQTVARRLSEITSQRVFSKSSNEG